MKKPFPIFKTKTEGVNEKFALEDPAGRRKYFEAKAGKEIEKIREYLEKSSFMAILLGPKNSGKGTYTKLFMEAVGTDRIAHISVGDIVRSVHDDLEDENKKKKLISYLEQNYRGFITIEKAINIILGRDTKSLLPTEIILALVEREIDKIGKKAVFIDGFPRNLDQVSYSLYLRSLMGYRDDLDFFVFIDVPESVIDERIKNRVICSICKTPRSLRLLRTKEIGYDEKNDEFYLICDNPNCEGFGKERMIAKEGDELGIEVIRERVEMDKEIIEKIGELQGVPKIYLRNSIPVDTAGEYVDKYELTPAYKYELQDGEVKVKEEPWTIKDEEGKEAHSLLPAPVALALIKQVAQTIDSSDE